MALFQTSQSAFTSEYALIPVYQVAVSAGNGSFVDNERPEKYLAFRRRWLKWRGFDEQELAVVLANGDSMEPTIPNKSTLVVHTGRKQPKDGNIYVIRNGDQVWVKRIQVKPSSWLLLSENNFYPPIEIPMTEQSQFEIIGQVVHISRDVGE
ncbi:transcriptional regulator [Shewanella sp. KCT]|nr:transcriptional regulator [Shewanella sp. KCT]